MNRTLGVVRDGLLTGVKLGKGYIYTKEEIDKFLREQKNGA